MELNAYQSEAELDVRMKEGLHLPAAVLERLAAEVTRPFDLAGGGPLLRILLLRCPRGSSVVLFNLHHIIGELAARCCRRKAKPTSEWQAVYLSTLLDGTCAPAHLARLALSCCPLTRPTYCAFWHG